MYKNKAVDIFDSSRHFLSEINGCFLHNILLNKTKFATVLPNKFQKMGSTSITKAMLNPKQRFAGVVEDNKEKLRLADISLFGNTVTKSSTVFFTIDDDPTPAWSSRT